MDLVYLAIIPAQPIYSELRERMEYYSALLESKKALRNPPHVTLVPPFLTNHYEAFIADLQRVAAGLPAFTIELEGLHAYGDRVLVYPVKSDYISIIHDALMDVMVLHHEHRSKPSPRTMSKRKRELLGLYGQTNVKEFYHPHMTLAKSDLNKDKLKELMAEKPETLHHRIHVTHIHVLRMRPGGWEIALAVPLKEI